MQCLGTACFAREVEDQGSGKIAVPEPTRWGVTSKVKRLAMNQGTDATFPDLPPHSPHCFLSSIINFRNAQLIRVW